MLQRHLAVRVHPWENPSFLHPEGSGLPRVASAAPPRQRSVLSSRRPASAPRLGAPSAAQAIASSPPPSGRAPSAPRAGRRRGRGTAGWRRWSRRRGRAGRRGPARPTRWSRRCRRRPAGAGTARGRGAGPRARRRRGWGAARGPWRRLRRGHLLRCLPSWRCSREPAGAAGGAGDRAPTATAGSDTATGRMARGRFTSALARACLSSSRSSAASSTCSVVAPGRAWESPERARASFSRKRAETVTWSRRRSAVSVAASSCAGGAVAARAGWVGIGSCARTGAARARSPGNGPSPRPSPRCGATGRGGATRVPRRLAVSRRLSHRKASASWSFRAWALRAAPRLRLHLASASGGTAGRCGQAAERCGREAAFHLSHLAAPQP